MARGGGLEQRVRDFCARHDLLPAGSGVLLMVSGGADSMCLMHVVAAVHDGPVSVLAVDHGLRPAAADEARAVIAAAHDLGLPAQVESLGLDAGPAVLERARDARLAAAERVRAGTGLDVIATGHTLTDNAETILFRAARGTGRTGALGIAPRRDRLVRPLLGITRDETREWCRANRVAFVDDPTNHDLATARARVRHGLVPALEAVHPSAQRNLARMAALLADEAAVVDAAADAAWARLARGAGLDATALAAEPVAIARLLVRRLLQRAGLPSAAHEAVAVDAVLARAASDRGITEVPGGLVAVDGGVLVAERAGEIPPPIVDAPLGVPGSVTVPGLQLRAARGVAGRTTGDSAWVRATGGLVVRAPRGDDRIALPSGGHQAVGRMLQSAGVPARHRASVPVVAEGDRVLWVAGHRASADVVAAPGESAINLTAVPA
ncbi:MAG: tRNA lysidine(34) synthetase TilS [Actinomycetota bacterium]